MFLGIWGGVWGMSDVCMARILIPVALISLECIPAFYRLYAFSLRYFTPSCTFEIFSSRMFVW